MLLLPGNISLLFGLIRLTRIYVYNVIKTYHDVKKKIAMTTNIFKIDHWGDAEWSIYHNNLNVLRRSHKLKKYEFNEAIGLSNAFRKDLSKPGKSAILSICNKFNVTETWLSEFQDDLLDVKQLNDGERENKSKTEYNIPEQAPQGATQEEIYEQPRGRVGVGQKVEGRERVSIDVLRQLIEAVEEALVVRKLTATPDKKAEFIAFLYEYFTETGKEVSREFVERHLKLVA